ncbi:Transposon Ty3-G Gag-Pol polyprotein [Rhizoctonia solani]|uniref:Transposon Ty3-G Gag-Pol polyprotein n=1 Tax=Rhizoctonia solani TaxID=456999 RepID=A0A8H8T124_9AGAM|nr:Transposon Ty3-G Gag-Pol polyprotein [Rhizoctonia solani]QRW24058.1 Transposon Ty3-G Gag-Pol polyprotein [Rhizoctonia solani]
MLFLTKKSADGSVKLRTVLDKQALNDNTHKLASPLPDQADILWRVQKHKYRSLIDGKDAYEQIRVEPEDVPHTLFVTPNGTMVSKVMQQGDTNASATYQSLMNILLEKGQGKYWDVFLDNIVVYTNSIEEHISRMNKLFEILRRKKLYLSNGKIQFLVRKLNILGHVIDEKGIRMDPDKINNVLKWKTPTTKEQVMAFLGAVGYLAPNCEGIRIPMGVLSNQSAGNKHWNWDHTAQRAFKEVKMIVQKHRDNHRVAIDYSEEAPPINLVTDASCTGASGVLSQGKELSKAHVIAFWSGKFNSTQQNYAVHKLELLAIKESLDWFRHLLVGCKFNIYTDHRALEHFQTQKNLSPRQVRWLQVFNEFDYCIIYIPGETNVLANTLSQIYENERPGTVRATSKYVQDKDNVPDLEAFSAKVTGHVTGPITRPLLVAKEAIAAQIPILGDQAIETQGPMEINGVDLPNKETIEEPRRLSRNRKPGELGPFLPPASPELGKVSLKRVIRLLWGLQSQVNRIERTLSEQTEISQEVRTNVKNISQTVNVVKDGLAQLQSARGPHTPEEQKPPTVEETPRAAPKTEPIGKAQPFLGAPAPIISTGAPRRDPLSLFNPYPSLSFPLGPAPASQGPPPAPIVTSAQPPAPSTVKVDHPDAFKGKIGSEAKQWLTRMLAWVRLNQRQFPTDLEVLSFLLMNMEEAAGAWAHPHLDQLGSHCALIQTVDEFKNKFLAAFGDPDATRAAERKITSLTQTGTCAEYITKFRTLQMELDWNDAALRGQFARGLHWEVRKQIATRERQPRTLRELQDASLIIDNALQEERASHPHQGNKSGKSSTTPNRGASTGHQATKTGPLSSNPNYVSEEERNRRRAEGLCVKCGRAGHKFAECRTGWKATPKEDKGKAKETAKIGKESGPKSGKD